MSIFMKKIEGIEKVTSYSPLTRSSEHKLIGNILKEHPEMSKIMTKYFGEECLKRPSFKIKTLGLACILLGVDQNRLIQEFEKIQI
jgi:hypothetical protein